MSTHNMDNIPRGEKLAIADKLHANLRDRKKKGPPEPGLDAFIPDLAAVTSSLDTHVTGHVLADAAQKSRLARAEAADIEVDTWLRHIESFLSIEAHRRAGPHKNLAEGLYDAACPDGLAHIDDRIVDENAHCRSTLAVLKAPEHAQTIAAIGLPPAWITSFSDALDESDAAMNDVIRARNDRNAHIGKGRDAEIEWLDVMVRLRRYVASRAKRTDTTRKEQGALLLKPLLDALAKRRADAAARATRRAAKAAPKAATPPSPEHASEPA